MAEIALLLPKPLRTRPARRVKAVLVYLLPFAVLLLVWYLLAASGRFPRNFLPSPLAVAEASRELILDGRLVRNIVDSKRTAGTWFFAGAIVVFIGSTGAMPPAVQFGSTVLWAILAVAVIIDSVLISRRIKKLVTDYSSKGVRLVAINPNHPDSVRLDELAYSDLSDSFEEMKERAKQEKFNFLWLDDGPKQELSHKVGPVATPHVFIFDKSRKLRFEGRIDDSENESYATVIVLSRVVTQLGTVSRVTPKTIESLFVSDFSYLQDLYRIINFQDPSILDALEPGAPFPASSVEVG